MKIGSLCSGYGGLDIAAELAFDAETAWFVEYDDAPSKILKHHWPTVHNYGDMTTLDWGLLPPVEIVTAGYPCQPFSTAGKRKGATDDRHLWPYVLEAIRQLRPRFALLENVRGHLTLGFDRVLGDLAEAGYDTDWVCIPASAAGAPHRRERIFILAHSSDDGHERAGGARYGRAGLENDDQPSPDPGRERGERRRGSDDLAGTPRGGAGEGDQRQRDGDAADDRGAATPDPDDTRRLSVGRIESEQRDPDGRSSADQLWGDYEPAIRRWESILGRLAPAPTLPDGRSGNPRLSSAFVEWMMGLPAGHVTDVGLTRKEELKALGNGVVPQQAALALSLLIPELASSSKEGTNA